MAKGRKRGWLLKLVIIAAPVLLISGCVTGPIGASFLGTEPLLPQPKVHLPADEVFSIAGVPITNTILSSWLATLVLLGLFLAATRGMRLVPRGLQNLAEWVVEKLLGFVEGVAGERYARLFFPVIATIFLFVIVNAWLALLPIYHTIGYMDEEGHIKVDLLRNAATDLNMPLALALVSFVFVEFWGLRSLGLRYVGKFVRVGNLLRGRVLTGAIDLFVGVLEAFTEVIRILSFTFRLFGNMTAGKILVLLATFLVSFLFSDLFYGLEILVGFVQALIFAGLTLVFATVAVTPHEEEH